MSWVASGYVKTLTVSPTGQQITRGEKLVLLILADYHNQETNLCNPSINRLAVECLYERRQIMRVIESLESKSFIEVKRFPGQNRNNEYAICGLIVPYHSVSKGSDKMSPLPSSDKKGPGVVTLQEGGSDISASKMSPELVLTSKKQETQQAAISFPITTNDGHMLPTWLPMKEWEEWKKDRAERKIPVTEIAERMALRKLEKLRLQGEDPANVLSEAIIRRWRGIFSVKEFSKPAAVVTPEPDALEVMRSKERARGNGH